MRETFQEIGYTFEKSGKCSVCGKRRKRRQRFWQTYNPWNRHADGRMKTQPEIATEVREKGRAWKEAPLVCAACAQEPRT